MATKATGRKNGRPRKAVSEKIKRGSLNTTEEKQRKGKVVPLPAAAADMAVEYPPAPEDLGMEGKKHWEVVVRELTKIRLLTPVDLFALRAMCVEWECYLMHRAEQMAEGKKSYYAVKDQDGKVKSWQPHPVHYNGTNHLREYMRLASEFGLTPAARAQIGIGSTEMPKTKAAELLKRAV